MSDSSRFVLLRHETPAGYPRPSHWDFMIEVAGALRTWALAETPTDGRDIEAERLADHRIAYLELEGEISGGRGTVTRTDRGTYKIVRESENELLLLLRGEQLIGSALLTRQSPGAQPAHGAEAAQRWKFRFTSDRSAIGSPAGRGVGLGE
jgi:hypothetical protein